MRHLRILLTEFSPHLYGGVIGNGKSYNSIARTTEKKKRKKRIHV